MRKELILKTLIAYYSRPYQNYSLGNIINLKRGNTLRLAELIAKRTGGELFEIKQLHPYSRCYNECIDQACKDLKNKARPELAAYLDSLDDYDEVYLGFPNYWGDAPMAVYTFLEHLSLKGKTIHTFVTHEGSGLGRSLDNLAKAFPEAKFAPGLAVHGSHVDEAVPELDKWLKGE